MSGGIIGKSVSGEAERWTLSVAAVVKHSSGCAEMWTSVSPCRKRAKRYLGARLCRLGTSGLTRGVTSLGAQLVQHAREPPVLACWRPVRGPARLIRRQQRRDQRRRQHAHLQQTARVPMATFQRTVRRVDSIDLAWIGVKGMKRASGGGGGGGGVTHQTHERDGGALPHVG